MMKLSTTIGALLLALGLVPLAALAQSAPNAQAGVVTGPPSVAGVATGELTAKVIAVDPAQRTVTLQGASGKTRTIEVGDQVHNFEQIKVGDTVHAKYTQALALELKKGPAAMSAPTEDRAITPPPAPGAKPGGTIARKVTAVTEVVAVDAAKGDVKVLRTATAFECGAIVNPDHLKNQIEGAVTMGIGGALFEHIDFEDGKILNPTFGEYRLPRFKDTPMIETVLVNRPDLASAGAGETPIFGIAPAVGNAIFAATGVRLRSMPMVPDGLKLS